MSVVRQHEEFIWLHDRFVENEDYAGIVVSNVWDPGSQHQSFHAHIHYFCLHTDLKIHIHTYTACMHMNMHSDPHILIHTHAMMYARTHTHAHTQ